MVKIVQYKCANNHCILAAVYEDDKETIEDAKAKILETAKNLNLNPWCGLCGDRNLGFDERVTAFKTLEEAGPAMLEAMMLNMASRAAADELGASFDVKQHKNN